MKYTNSTQTSIEAMSKKEVAPVLCDYVYWVLLEAKRRNISTLHFLARDGYILLKIAEMICAERQIPIRCQYLFCSRISLRVPTYHLIGDEMYDLLFGGGYHITLRSFFERSCIKREEWTAILEEIGIDKHVDLDKELSNAEVNWYKEHFKSSVIFRKHVLELSRMEYPNMIAYLRQEGIFDQDVVGIVDSGWTGSMQRSLRQLIRSTGAQNKITGFYFGMYVTPSDPEDGEYLSWYFSGKDGKTNKIFFCNNLFECFLSAPHGMTLRYQKTEDGIRPVLHPAPEGIQQKRIQEQIEGILTGASERIHSGMTTEITDSQRIFRRIMGRPDRAFATLYGEFAFCDDITENYYFSLADQSQCERLKSYLIFPRIFRKFTHTMPDKQKPELFWPYGTVAFVDNPLKKLWYWLNIYLWAWVKYTLK